MPNNVIIHLIAILVIQNVSLQIKIIAKQLLHIANVEKMAMISVIIMKNSKNAKYVMKANQVISNSFPWMVKHVVSKTVVIISGKVNTQPVENTANSIKYPIPLLISVIIVLIMKLLLIMYVYQLLNVQHIMAMQINYRHHS